MALTNVVEQRAKSQFSVRVAAAYKRSHDGGAVFLDVVDRQLVCKRQDVAKVSWTDGDVKVTLQPVEGIWLMQGEQQKVTERMLPLHRQSLYDPLDVGLSELRIEALENVGDVCRSAILIDHPRRWYFGYETPEILCQTPGIVPKAWRMTGICQKVLHGDELTGR